MMKQLLPIVLFFFLVLSFISCEKVIDLNLNEDNEKIIIEAIVNKDSTAHYIYITKTLAFDESTTYPTVDNAIVTLSDNVGNSETLNLIAPGIYKSTSFLAVEGRTYYLNVTIDNKLYASSSTMPYNVPIDTVSLQEFSFGPVPNFFPIAERMDPKDIKNYYSFTFYKNNKRINGIYLQDDQFSDGVKVLEPIFAGDCTNKDTLRLEMACIDQFVHKYFYTLNVNAGGTGGAIPANPESNISGGCLGYFSAQTLQIKTIIIP